MYGCVNGVQYNGKECLLRDSCGGLLVFGGMVRYSKVSIVNCITKEIRVIESPRQRTCGYICGFFFDRFENKYTLLHVDIFTEHVYYIFGLSKNVWRRLDSETSSDFHPNVTPPTIVNDVLYWIAKYSSSCTKTIVAFKIETKEFYSMPHPQVNDVPCSPTQDRVVFTHAKLMQLVVKNGKLCFCHTIFHDRVIDLWILEDSTNWGSWVKKYKVHLSHVDKRFRLIGYSNDSIYRRLELVRIFSTEEDSDEILFTWTILFNRTNKGLCKYNLETHYSRKLETSTKSKFGQYVVVPHTKTLLSPFLNAQ